MLQTSGINRISTAIHECIMRISQMLERPHPDCQFHAATLAIRRFRLLASWLSFPYSFTQRRAKIADSILRRHMIHLPENLRHDVQRELGLILRIDAGR